MLCINIRGLVNLPLKLRSLFVLITANRDCSVDLILTFSPGDKWITVGSISIQLDLLKDITVLSKKISPTPSIATIAISFSFSPNSCSSSLSVIKISNSIPVFSLVPG